MSTHFFLGGIHPRHVGCGCVLVVCKSSLLVMAMLVLSPSFVGEEVIFFFSSCVVSSSVARYRLGILLSSRNRLSRVRVRATCYMHMSVMVGFFGKEKFLAF